AASALAGDRGASLNLAAGPAAEAPGAGRDTAGHASAVEPAPDRTDVLLFGEAAASVLVAIQEQHLPAARAACATLRVPWRELGSVGGHEVTIAVAPAAGVSLSLDQLRAAHERTFAQALG